MRDAGHERSLVGTIPEYNEYMYRMDNLFHSLSNRILTQGWINAAMEWTK